jgi:uncharacterized protein (TIGR02145 family)
MLSPRLTNCPECANIPSLLKKIDCKLAELGNSLYNNISYMLNQPIPAGDILQLIAYRRILMHKYCNPNYVYEYSVAMIASRVIRLTVGCVSKCNEPERCLEEPCDIKIVPNPTTTSTSTLPITTTTSTSSTTSTTTTAVPTTTTTSSSSTSTTTTLAPSGIRTIYTTFESLTPLTTTTTSSSTSSTTTTTTTIPSTSTTTSTSSSTSTTTSTSSSTTTTTTTVAPVAFGLMYNWYAARDSRNIAAIGWEVPTIFDYQTLADYLGAAGNYNTNTVGGRLKEIGLTYWLTPNTGAINDVGFNGKGSGVRNVTFTTKGSNCNFWTRSEIFSNIGGASQLYSNSAEFGCLSNAGYVSTVGYSIRLKKITTTLTNGQTGTYVGNDGRVYRTICIGTQEWVADDICETRFRNLDIVPYNGLDNPNNFTDAEWAGLSTAGTCAYNNDVNNVAPGFNFPI